MPLGLVQPGRDLLDEGQRGLASAVAVHFLCVPVDIVADAFFARFFEVSGLEPRLTFVNEPSESPAAE